MAGTVSSRASTLTMPSVAVRSRDATHIGRHGVLEAVFEKQGATTVLTHSKASSPWHFLPPSQLDPGVAHLSLVNPSGGLVGGDDVRVAIALQAGSHVVCSTPSANRVYRSELDAAKHTISISVGPKAALEWVPDHTIPFAGSRFMQTLRVTMEPGGTAVVWDALAAGRIARGERWAWADLANEVEIVAPSGERVLERYRVTAGGNLLEGTFLDWNYMGTLYIVGDAIREEIWKRLEERIVETLDDRQGRVLGGVSEPAVRGLIVKLLAKSAPDFVTTFQNLWAAARAQLWGLPFPALRRY